MDFKNMGANRVMVVTDANVKKLNAMKQVIQALEQEGVPYDVFDGVRVEPKDSSIKQAIEYAKPYRPDAFLAVGGGSVIDTAKLMNLYTSFPGTFSNLLSSAMRNSHLSYRCRLPGLCQCTTRSRTPHPG